MIKVFNYEHIPDPFSAAKEQITVKQIYNFSPEKITDLLFIQNLWIRLSPGKWSWLGQQSYNLSQYHPEIFPLNPKTQVEISDLVKQPTQAAGSYRSIEQFYHKNGTYVGCVAAAYDIVVKDSTLTQS